MKVTAVVLAVILLLAQTLAEEEWDNWGKETWDENGEANAGNEWGMHENEWSDQIYSSGSFNTIFVPLMLASFVVARIARR